MDRIALHNKAFHSYYNDSQYCIDICISDAALGKEILHILLVKKICYEWIEHHLKYFLLRGGMLNRHLKQICWSHYNNKSCFGSYTRYLKIADSLAAEHHLLLDMIKGQKFLLLHERGLKVFGQSWCLIHFSAQQSCEQQSKIILKCPAITKPYLEHSCLPSKDCFTCSTRHTLNLTH